MYEDYLEDYVYKLMAKIGSRICRLFISKRNDNKNVPTSVSSDSRAVTKSVVSAENDDMKSNNNTNKHSRHDKDVLGCSSNMIKNESVKFKNKHRKGETDDQVIEIDKDLNGLNFHMMMFFLWLVVAIVNIPALLTWARNFK